MKKNKNIYDILNDTNFDIEDYKREELSDIEKKKIKNKFKKSKKKKFNFKKFGSIAVAILLTVGVLSQTNLGKNVYAAAESKLSEITYSIGYVLNIERDIEKYSNVINKTIENNNVEIRLTDVVIDKDELIFSTITDIGTPSDANSFEYDVFVNGKKLKALAIGGGTSTTSGRLPIDTHIAKFKDTDVDIKEDLDIKIVLRNLKSYTLGNSKEDIIENSIKGKWEFEFRANGRALTANTYSLPLEYSFNISEKNYKLEEFRYNPVNQKIYGTAQDEYEFSHIITLMGYDDLGNKVEFDLYRYENKELIFDYSNYSNEGKDLSDDAESITLAPYAVENPKETGAISKNYKQVGEEFTINLE